MSREKLALTGGILIIASGLVSIWIGGREEYMLYQPDPGGVFGHVGVLAELQFFGERQAFQQLPAVFADALEVLRVQYNGHLAV